MTGTLVADISEYQPDVADATYLKWSQAVIIRAMYGATPDKAWYGGARRNSLHAGGAQFVGIYAYIRAYQSVIAQAHALLALIGSLRPGEKLIADIEEGTGSQAARWQTWAAIVQAATGDRPWCYSDLSFAATHDLSPEWVAAFGEVEPATPHILWQFSSAYAVPGVGTADCSLFHGSIGQLAALAYQPDGTPAAEPASPKAPAPSVPANWQEKTMAGLPTLKLGAKDSKEPWMVRRVQGLIEALGPHCEITGTYDAATETAVKTFQHNHGIKDDGIVGPVTWSMLITGKTP
jgi:peptidoglycan hydrolase-like protein with peptidoglycan-binding domain